MRFIHIDSPIASNNLPQCKYQWTDETVRDLVVLPNGLFLAAYQTSVRFYSKSGDELSTLYLKSVPLSLGVKNGSYCVTCIQKLLIIFTVEQGFRLTKAAEFCTQQQYSCIVGYNGNQLLAVVMDKPLLHIFEIAGTTLAIKRCISLSNYGVDIKWPTSYRRIYVTGDNEIFITDRSNEFLLTFAASHLDSNDMQAIVVTVKCPVGITVDDDKSVFAARRWTQQSAEF